ncbi:MAG TPA: TIGR04282 family arsenosugar biosynthesis glycosyltransferase [Pyrinomonadaceae bacterium]|nr:TIGR04282 family arsenosugar biosynthesis glycosyltransferase [Pyrinomonadaceae bacterium]
MNTPYPILDPRACVPKATRAGSCALAVMTKAPRAGESKTRLVPPLTDEEAARLSASFLSDTAANIAGACAENSGGARTVDAVAAYTPVGAEAAFDALLPQSFALLAQRGGSFGERLFHAAYDLFALGYESCCLINSDSPTLPRALLTAAINQLQRPNDRIVLGASDDGGYYLIGMKRAHPRLFEEIAWSTPEVLAQTIERAREITLDVALLPAWYDVDEASTLRRLCAEMFDARQGDASPCNMTLAPYPAPHTRAELARLLEGDGRTRIYADTLARGESAA